MDNRWLLGAFTVLFAIGAAIGGLYGLATLVDVMDQAEQDLGA